LTSAGAQQHEPGAHVHADAAKLANPVKPTPASIAAGKKLYEAQCVSCHGTTGVGDGKMATKMTPKPSNLTDASWKHGSSDGEIYTLIKDGTKDTPMKGFASKMTAQDMWSVVNYLRTLNTSK
jgi:mono/diheme cytochrome c family protein